jgi:hypothetical protein
MRTLSTLAAASLLLASVGTATPALAHGDGDRNQEVRNRLGASGVESPLMSDNVALQTARPGTAAISGCFTGSAPTFVVSGLDRLTVFDVSDPVNPTQTGTIANAVFENEAMTCGERRTPQGDFRRFALVGIDLYNVAVDQNGVSHTNEGDGQELMIVEVTDPANPSIRGTVESTTGTHTVACVPSTNCRLAYSSGEQDEFSIFDLSRLGEPRELDSDPDEEGIQPFASPTGGHKWNFDNAGYGIHTGYDGSSMFDLSKPRDPRLVTTTGRAGGLDPEQDGLDGYNDFIHHNSARPGARKFTPGAAPSVDNGNVLLVTEEDYVQTDCAQAGSFQTWHVERLSARAPAAIKPLDKVELADLQAQQDLNLDQPQGTFCSAHWFDYHPSGIVAIGYYGGGTQFIDVRDPRRLRSFGYAYTGASEVWDSMWVPTYGPGGHQTGGKTNVVYSIDLVQGLNVYSVDLPGKKFDLEPAGTPVAAPSLRDRAAAGAVPAGLVGGALALVVALRRRTRSLPG